MNEELTESTIIVPIKNPRGKRVRSDQKKMLYNTYVKLKSENDVRKDAYLKKLLEPWELERGRYGKPKRKWNKLAQ